MEELGLLVTYTVKEGLRDAFIQEVFRSKILDKICQEDGCLRYEYYCAATNEDQVLLLERWSTEEHQKVHLQQSHMDILRNIKDSYVVDTKVEKFKTIHENE